MIKDFKLETILTSITGINCCKEFSDFWELANFFINGNIPSSTMISTIEEPLKKHLISLYPALADVKYNSQFETSLNAWINSQKEIFGETLPVCRINETLESEKTKTKKLK